MSDKQPHIAVLGGGLAGLTAAWRLSRSGARVTLCEAGPTVGGRSRTDDLDGFRIDVGTQLIGSMYRRFRQLVDDIGLGGSMISSPGRDALWRGGRAHEVVYGSVTSMIASGGLPLTTKMRLGAVYVPFLSRHASALDLLHPGAAAEAGLDRESIQKWGEREIDRAFVRSLVYPQLGAYYGSVPEETSAGFYHILARYGMEVDLYAAEGGVGHICDRLAQLVIGSGGRVLTESPVSGLRLDRQVGGIHLQTGTGEQHFDGAVSGLPAPTIRGLLDGVSPRLDAWLREVRYRPCLSIALILDRPPTAKYFGLSFPQGESDSIAAVCLENNKPGADIPEGKGLMVVIPTPESAPELIELESREVVDRVIPDLDRAFPGTSGRIERARVYRWPVGTPVFYPGYLGHLGSFDPRAIEADLPLTIAGDYLLSPSVEGAVVSGMDAADRILPRLTSHSEA